MLVKTVSFNNTAWADQGQYSHYLSKLLSDAKRSAPCLAVLPAFTSLLYAYQTGRLDGAATLDDAVSAFSRLTASCLEEYNALHAGIARETNCWLVAGSIFAWENDRLYHEARLFSPDGEHAGLQRQLFLSRRERGWGLARGEELAIFDIEGVKTGLLVGTDAWYPETGRVLALKGAEVVCHCGALAAGSNGWLQLAGIWQQVQQNQFFAVESQLSATIAGERFHGESLVHAPCEMTEGFTGIVARGGPENQPVVAQLNRIARTVVINTYPLLRLLNPSAYTTLTCERGR